MGTLPLISVSFSNDIVPTSEPRKINLRSSISPSPPVFFVASIYDTQLGVRTSDRRAFLRLDSTIDIHRSLKHLVGVAFSRWRDPLALLCKVDQWWCRYFNELGCRWVCWLGKGLHAFELSSGFRSKLYRWFSWWYIPW